MAQFGVIYLKPKTLTTITIDGYDYWSPHNKLTPQTLQVQRVTDNCAIFELNTVIMNTQDDTNDPNYPYIITSDGYGTYIGTKRLNNGNDILTLQPAINIPNITINGSDYWNTHKSEYNTLIGNPVGTFKIDLSSYNTTANTLYAWTTTGYYDINDTTKPLTVYTLSETPAVNDKTYDSDGDEFDGRCWTGAEEGTVSNNINGVTSTTITLGMGKPTPVF